MFLSMTISLTQQILRCWAKDASETLHLTCHLVLYSRKRTGLTAAEHLAGESQFRKPVTLWNLLGHHCTSSGNLPNFSMGDSILSEKEIVAVDGRCSGRNGPASGFQGQFSIVERRDDLDRSTRDRSDSIEYRRTQS